MPLSARVLLLCAALVGAPAASVARPTGAPLVRFGFRWDRDWSWRELESHVSRATPDAAEHLDHLRRAVPLPRARLLLRYLAALPTIAAVRRVPDRLLLDGAAPRKADVRRALEAAVGALRPRDALADMLLAGDRLAEARARLKDWFIPDVTGREYRPEPVHGSTGAGLQVRFDLHVARKLAGLLGAARTPEAQWADLADDPVIGELLAHRGPARLTRGALIEWWRRAQDTDPVNRLYEWTYPGSFYGCGGVAADPGAYLALLRQIERARASLSDRVRAALARFLPADLRMTATVSFLFAGDADGWATPGGLGIDLEHFGDDYDRLARVITHECFHRAQSVAQLPITSLAPDPIDRRLYDGLLTPVWREGTASYAGPPWPSGPPRDTAASDAAYFGEAFAALYRAHDGPGFRDRVAKGLEMAGPLYRLGWRMARTIETRLGPGALADVQTLGPAVFFARYIEARERDPAAGDPDAPRFGPEVEAAIGRLAAGLDAPTLLAASRIARLGDRSRMRAQARRFRDAHRADPRAGLALVELGEVLARGRGECALAGSLIPPGLRLLGARTGDLVRREGYLLLSLGAAPQALDVFRVGVALAPGDPAAACMLGEGYRLVGDRHRARSAYRRALELSPDYEPARHGLALVGE